MQRLMTARSGGIRVWPSFNRVGVATIVSLPIRLQPFDLGWADRSLCPEPVIERG
jgi:hypothetical protein